MADADWKEILSYSQKELVNTDTETLCEKLCWMDSDYIDMNFTDLKTLFKLAQDILKYKTEQVKDLLGRLDTRTKLNSKPKTRKSYKKDSVKNNRSLDVTQKESTKTNKETVEQLQSDITENKLQRDVITGDRESESSRATMSELDAIMQLENEVTLKNKHIRKLLHDIKMFEEENTKLKEKVLLLKDKLTDATKIINNLTEQVITLNNEYTQLKEVFANSEQVKAQLSITVETLRNELSERNTNAEHMCEDIKNKVQHWKNIARSKQNDIEILSAENTKLKDLINVAKPSDLPKPDTENEAKIKIKKLQDKLSEASEEIEQSANLIKVLKCDNIRLKNIIDEIPESSSDVRNESDDGKERAIINKLKKKVRSLTASLEVTEEMVTSREKELADITTQLHLLHSDEGMYSLLDGLKNKKRQLKLKDEVIKSLIQEINTLREELNNLQMENETLRQRFNVPADEKISARGIQKHYHDLERINININKELRIYENKLISLELDNRTLKRKLSEMTKRLKKFCISNNLIRVKDVSNGYKNTKDDLGSTSLNLQNDEAKTTDGKDIESELQRIIEENEGLRQGLQEISELLKDNSTTSSGILKIECPSLDAVLRCMEARHMAGWFAPHMTTAMELRTALGGKEALLTALHETRMETFDVMNQLSKESKKSSELEQKLIEAENRSQSITEDELSIGDIDFGDFGTWITDRDIKNIDLYDGNQIKNIIAKGDCIYEKKLKRSLQYFHTKFKALYKKMTLLTIEAADNNNKWLIKDEQYKAQLESFKSQLEERDDDVSDVSPGIVPFINNSTLERKCLYIEQIYKYTKTLYENIKNENLELRKEIMAITSEYEIQIQNLILSLVGLTDKLRSSISIELFWEQNKVLNELNLKYRQTLEENFRSQNNSMELDKNSATNTIQIAGKLSSKEKNQLRDQLKQLNLQSGLQPAYLELFKNMLNLIDHLEKANKELQEIQSKMIDESLASVTKQEIDIMKDQLNTLATENKFIKEQYQCVKSELEIALLQLNDHQKRQINNDMEVNLLRHQILDLQSSGDNKAIISRLSNEVIVTHLQASEYQNKLENITLRLNKEKELKIEAKNMINAYEKIFEAYTYKYQSKFKYMYNILQIMRQQYQGSVPLVCVENYLNKLEDISRKQFVVNDQLTEIENLRSNLMIKHSVFDQILDISKNKCLIDDDICPHKLEYVVMQKTHIRESEHLNKRLEEGETVRTELIKQCNALETHLILVNQIFEKKNLYLTESSIKNNKYDNMNPYLDYEQDSKEKSNSRRSETITLSKPKILKSELNKELNKVSKDIPNKDIIYSSVGTQCSTKIVSVVSVMTQTMSNISQMVNSMVQTDADTIVNNLKICINDLYKENEHKSEQLNEALHIDKIRTEEISVLKSEKSIIESKIVNLQENCNEKDKLIQLLRNSFDELKEHVNDITTEQLKEQTQLKDRTNAENKCLLQALKQLEQEKNSIVAEYKELVSNERDEYSKFIQELQLKIVELETKLDRKASEPSATNANAEPLKDVINKYAMKITEVEEKCFKLQNELDECKTELTTYQSEVIRWKDLATERLSKMEQLNSQLEERHCHEVETYKAENQHWLSQLNETQKEHMELRTRLTEQKALYIKQLADKDVHIEQLRTLVHNLKTQVINMQTMLSVNDPSFDLSAIAEVEEGSDALSHNGSDRLEIKFDSTVDLNDDDILRIPGSSTTIWQETIIERLRREKQLASKQNTILRRQIKALAARERRARLDAQNLKNQIFRINTSGCKVATAETTALQNKIATLQAQLTSARRDTQSNVTLWDKWKRAQQAAERWQSRYEDKCQEIKRLESNLNLAKSSVTRLQREKRLLLSRLSEINNESRFTLEKQDAEPLEKSHRSITDTNVSLNEKGDAPSAQPVSTQALLQRVQAQQHRIAALEIAEKGNEHLVSEYERCLAEITSLKGQVIKLESTLLESQIRTPANQANDRQPELDYWKGYCEMLKQENIQLTLKINSTETLPSTVHQQRVHDLERTILTLRDLVSKLHAEQKSSGVHKRPEANQRPYSGRTNSEKNRNQLDSYRIEIANLKRTIEDKDLLLERSKEMLNIAAEREDELLRMNECLRRRIDDLTKTS